ncbi:hypothetical protein AB3X52_08040 [Nocardioides sp. DS6]|uniref:EfeO-type cupredoxin-like domain-containing protein n=1 Tax=Nocardioides eburneus TaxID=3231482 RepID=A0ABV3SYM0_9ACTN
MRRSVRASLKSFAIVATLLGVVGLVTACGSSDDNPSSGASGPKVIDVTFKGDSVTPSGDIITVARGQKVEFEVTADTAGEIHVHSDPAKEYEYKAGTTHISVGSFNVPGRIEVESHALEKTICILEIK